MPKILISYRRPDSGAITGRIRDRPAQHYGEDSVFMDIDNIPFGMDFRQHIGGDNPKEIEVLAGVEGANGAFRPVGKCTLTNRLLFETRQSADQPDLRDVRPRVEMIRRHEGIEPADVIKAWAACGTHELELHITGGGRRQLRIPDSAARAQF